MLEVIKEIATITGNIHRQDNSMSMNAQRKVIAQYLTLESIELAHSLTNIVQK